VAVTASLISRLHRTSGAARWGVSEEAWRVALEASIAHAFPDRAPTAAEVESHVGSLHAADLALACGCAAGNDAAWEHFVREHRPGLYRAADAIDPSGGARDLADSLYGELYGVRNQGATSSLFRYFHGRSRLGTWLRALLAQRYVDRVRAQRRLVPLPDEETPRLRHQSGHAAADPPDPARDRCLEAVRGALAAAIAALVPRDRLRLSSYYAHDLTLAAIGRMLHEHEGTVSRHLTRTRRDLRAAVLAHMTARGFDADASAACLQWVMEDAGPLVLGAR
jgi:RNA polymerase sigma factor (sigma-70 family)